MHCHIKNKVPDVMLKIVLGVSLVLLSKPAFTASNVIVNVVIKSEMSDGSVQYGQAIAIARFKSQLRGRLYLTANNIIRSDIPFVSLKNSELLVFDDKKVNLLGNIERLDASLFEISITGLNIGFLLANKPRILPGEDAVCERAISKSQSGYFQWINPKTGKKSTRSLTFLSAFNHGILTAQVQLDSGVPSSWYLGSVVMIHDQPVGFITHVDNVHQQITIVSVRRIVNELRKYNIFSVFTDTVTCADLEAEVNGKQTINYGLEFIFINKLKPGVLWADFYRELYPDEEDLKALYGQERLTQVKKIYKKMQNESELSQLRYRGGTLTTLDVQLNCKNISPETYAYKQGHFARVPYSLNQLIRECSFRHQLRFAYVNGHWIWIKY